MSQTAAYTIDYGRPLTLQPATIPSVVLCHPLTAHVYAELLPVSVGQAFIKFRLTSILTVENRYSRRI